MRLILATVLLLSPAPASPGDLAKDLLFHAGFDGTVEADFGAGDRALYHGLGTPLKDVKPGLPEQAELAKGAGKFGDALRFPQKIKQVVFYKVRQHVAWT